MIRVPPALIFLVFAWLCANRPQGIITEIAHWWSTAGTFSHQAQLAGELRIMLAQATPSSAEAIAVAERSVPTEERSSAAVAPGSFQKIEFALPEAVRVPAPAAERWQFHRTARFAAAQPRDVPVPVPRAMRWLG